MRCFGVGKQLYLHDAPFSLHVPSVCFLSPMVHMAFYQPVVPVPMPIIATPQHADAIRQLRARGCGLVGAEVVDDVTRRLAAVFRARGDLISLELSSDVGPLFRYLHSGREMRRELLAGKLYVRCTAAMLCRGEMGELEVDAGSSCGYEYINLARVLRINVGVHVEREETYGITRELWPDDPTGAIRSRRTLQQTRQGI